MKILASRENQVRLLEQVWQSKKAELLVLYGRRRIGKTHLIRYFFSLQKQSGIYFELTGLKQGTLQQQLNNFAEKFSAVFYSGLAIKPPSNWHDAFNLLQQEIDKTPKKQKFVLFLDELPWLATKKSGLLDELDYFWNSKWSLHNNLIVVLCGSAASWMLDKIINAKGGLHNRLTRKLLLKPFTLKQTEEFLLANQCKKTRKQILDLYMVLGGVPLYLQQVKRQHSAAQNIQQICFNENGLLYAEFENLYQALFQYHEKYIDIVRTISKRHYGIASDQLLKALKQKSGGRFFKRLIELESAGFIKKYHSLDTSKKGVDYYRTSDEFSNFYFCWLEHYLQKQATFSAKNYWLTRLNTPIYASWAGYTFENICFKHSNNIARALGIDQVASQISTWQTRTQQGSKQNGAQVDLIFDREDGIITLCEIRYSKNDIVLTKEQARQLAQKVTVFEENFPTKKQVSLVLITVSGLKENIWSEDLIDQVITLDDLFTDT